ncbi:MAG: aromatic amino acid transport family protein [Cyanophyceae cyanobacterium]
MAGDRWRHRPGRLGECIALVAGTTVGAGILALPAATQPVGTIPATVVMVAVWAYMAVCGLVMGEIVLNAMARTGRPAIGLLNLVRDRFGPSGARLAGGLYAALHYALIVAYLDRGGEILGQAIADWGWWFGMAVPPAWVGPALFVVIFGGLLYFGTERFVDSLNALLFTLALGAFGLLVAAAAGQWDGAHLAQGNWGAIGQTVPIAFVALVYQNIVPTLAVKLEGDSRQLRRAILLGTGLPLLMFVVWNGAILGSVGDGWGTGDPFDPLDFLRQQSGVEWLGAAIAIFSEFAVATSLIGQVYGLYHFFNDAVPWRLGERERRLPLYSLIFGPPLGLVTGDTSLFFAALDYAGAFGVSILFGIMPAAVAWQQRDRVIADGEARSVRLLPGGKGILAITILIAVGIISQQILEKIG